ncbi:MAG: alpha/beta hydrolase [Cyanobacteria bacterium SBLK]|nr:alpha/beta hydrolase [Cyanobacteria bacterium SBLK]
MLLNFLFSLTGVGVIYVFCCVALLKWQNRFVFVPSSELKKNPHDFNLDYEEIWISVGEENESRSSDRSERGQNTLDKIHGWWIPSPNRDRRNEKTILFFHGNAFNIGANLKQTVVFHRLGLSVLMIDYRGYGKSKGQFPTESQVYEDAQIALDYLTEQKNISHREIIIYGHSLGGAIAIELATKNPDLAALIIQGSFTSLREMVDHDKIYNIFPVDLLLNHYFDSINKIVELQMPLLFVHGDADRRVPAWMSQTLYETAKTALKDLYIVPEGDHDRIAEIGGEDYYGKLEEFITSVTNHQSSVTSDALRPLSEVETSLPKSQQRCSEAVERSRNEPAEESPAMP